MTRWSGREPTPLPDFKGDQRAMQRWVYQSFPISVAADLTREEWANLFALVQLDARSRDDQNDRR